MNGVNLPSATVAGRSALLRDGLLILGGSLLIALCAKVQVPGPLPMTMQTFGVVLVAAVLGSRRGAAAIIAYLLEGACGLPAFARPFAGPAYFAGDTAGYLYAFVVAAFVVGLLIERGWGRRLVTVLAAMGLGHAIILLVGLAWRSFYVGAEVAVIEGLWIMLPGTILKAVAAAAVFPVCRRLVSTK